MTAGNTSTSTEVSRFGSAPIRGAIIVGIGIAVSQVLAYLLSLVGARLLGPDGFGVLASLLALTLIGGVVALGIQAVAARRLVRLAEGERANGGAGIVRATLIAAGITAIVSALLAPFLSNLLHITGFGSVLLVAVSLFPLTVFGGLLGIAQGRERNGLLAWVYVLTGIGRAAGGIIGLAVGDTVFSTMVGLAIGSVVAVLIACLVVRPLVARPAIKLPAFGRESAHAAHALLALFVLTNIDVLLARHFLPASEAGMYAAGAIVAKVTFWLPLFVAVAAFPRMADHRRAATLTISAAAVALIGLLATLAIALLPNLVVRFVGGQAYGALASEVWLFAAAGAAFGLAQFLLYSHLASDNRMAVAVLWAATAILVGVVWFRHESVLQIVSTVLAVALGVCLIGVGELIVERRFRREPELSTVTPA